MVGSTPTRFRHVCLHRSVRPGAALPAVISNSTNRITRKLPSAGDGLRISAHYKFSSRHRKLVETQILRVRQILKVAAGAVAGISVCCGNGRADSGEPRTAFHSAATFRSDIFAVPHERTRVWRRRPRRHCLWSGQNRHRRNDSRRTDAEGDGCSGATKLELQCGDCTEIRRYHRRWWWPWRSGTRPRLCLTCALWTAAGPHGRRRALSRTRYRSGCRYL